MTTEETRRLDKSYRFYIIAHANGTISDKLDDLHSFCQTHEEDFAGLRVLRWQLEAVKPDDHGDEPYMTLDLVLDELSTIAPKGFACSYHEGGGCIGFWPTVEEDCCPVCNLCLIRVTDSCPGCNTRLYIVTETRLMVSVHYDAT